MKRGASSSAPLFLFSPYFPALRIADLTARRDALAAQIRSALDAAEFAGVPLDDRQSLDFIVQAAELIAESLYAAY